MVIFFGIVALLVSTWLMLRLRRERAFRGERVELRGYVVERTVRTHKGRTTLSLGVASGNAELSVKPEDAFARFLKTLNIGRDVTCGDRRLDERLLFESDDPRVVLWLKSASEAREAIGAVFDLGAERLMAHGGRIWATFNAKTSEIDVDVVSVQLAVALHKLAASMPGTITGPHERSVFHAGRALFLLALSGGMGIAAAVMFFAHVATKYPQHVQGFGMYAAASLISMLIGAVLWWLAAQWIKDSARARPVLIDLALIGLTSFVVIGTVSVGNLNVLLASGPSMVEEVTAGALIRRESRRKRRRSSTSYYIELPALQDGKVPANRYALSASDYAALHTGARVRVESQRGFFGPYFLLRAPQKVD